MILSVVLNIAVVLAVLKGADLLLRKSQQLAVQRFLEDITLHLEELSPRDTIIRLSSPDAQFCFIVLAYFELVLVVLINMLWFVPSRDIGTSIKVAEGLGLLLTAVSLVVGWSWPIPQLVRAIVGTAKSRFVVIARFALFLVVSFLFFGTVEYALSRLNPRPIVAAASSSVVDLGSVSLVAIAATLVVWPLFVIFFVTSQTIGALLQAKTFYVRWMFAFLRGLLWRLIEFDKGSVAAIALLITTILTVLKELAAG